MSSTPFISSSSICATESERSCVPAPVYEHVTVIVTGVICGYSATAMRERHIAPHSATTIATTHAARGWSMNICEKLRLIAPP